MFLFKVQSEKLLQDKINLVALNYYGSSTHCLEYIKILTCLCKSMLGSKVLWTAYSICRLLIQEQISELIIWLSRKSNII